MTTICNRFKQVREDRKMTITAVAAAIGENRQRVQDIEIGKQKVPEDIIVKYIEYFNIDANWLLTGEGEMLKGKATATKPSIVVDGVRLTLAIETVEEGLEVTHRRMNPDKKAELIMAVYDLFKNQDANRDNKQIKQSMLKLVQSIAA
jgi:transcriptional regulator with XRE-family HTH domain